MSGVKITYMRDVFVYNVPLCRQVVVSMTSRWGNALKQLILTPESHNVGT
jgi:hypothetical protein